MFRNKKISIIIYLIIFIFSSLCYAQTKIDQKLSIIENDRKLNGELVIGVDIKGTDLDTITTLGSATIDIQYDKDILEFVKDSAAIFQLSDGYDYSVSTFSNSDGDYLRIGVFGIDVNGTSKTGYNLSDAYDRWITLKFKILNVTEFANLFILGYSNAIGLFNNNNNHQYEPYNDVINNIDLSEPMNIFSEPLPVELENFMVNAEGNSVYLEWNTATETNNSGFEIYRSADNINWVNISFVKGNITTTTSNRYTFVDKNPTGGSSFKYKLKQIDLDGSFKYSEVQEVILLPAKFELFGNYPNPFNPSTNIKYSIPARSRISINIYSITGEKILTINKTHEAGNYTESIDLKSYASGAYIYSLEAVEEEGSRNFTSFKKMLLIK